MEYWRLKKEIDSFKKYPELKTMQEATDTLEKFLNYIEDLETKIDELKTKNN